MKSLSVQLNPGLKTDTNLKLVPWRSAWAQVHTDLLCLTRGVLCGPDVRGFVVLQESPRGGEDDAVRHGPGLIEDARHHRLSGPKRQVRNNNKLLRVTHGVNDEQLNRGLFIFQGLQHWNWEAEKVFEGLVRWRRSSAEGNDGAENMFQFIRLSSESCRVFKVLLSSSYTGRIVLRCDWLISGTVLRSTWIPRGRSSPPAAPTRTSPSLTTSQESVSPPCSDTQVRKSNNLCLFVRYWSVLRWKSLLLWI